MPTARARRGLRALVAATAISSAGDGAFVAAAPLAAAAVTRDPALVALVTAAEYLPWLVVAPFAGFFVDRWPRRSTVIVADLLRMGLVGILAVLLATGSASITVIALCAFGIVTGNVFHSASTEAMIADLTGRDEALLHTVNGRQQAAYTGGRQLAGPPLGSWLFGLARWLPFALDAVSFLVSGLLLMVVPRRPAVAERAEGIWRSLRRSTGFLLGHRTLRSLALLTAAGNISINMVLGILVLYATDDHGLGITESGYGLLLAAMAAGGVLGGFLASRVIGWLGPRVAVIGGLAAEGGAWLALAATSHPLIAGAALALGYVGVAVVSVVVMSTRQRQVPPGQLGQVISAFRVIGNGPGPLGAIIGGLIAAAAGLRAPILVAAAVTLLAVLLVLRIQLTNSR
ncbi:MAG: MFS transporter [Micromonosporaceae bacterium]|nr:MFS transporter [Micromonosporaceae bacterium]